MTIGFSINTEGCFGCKACQMACADEHQQRPGVFMRRVRELQQGSGKGVVFVSMACNHCDDPQCMKVCPVNAYSKLEDGTVVQDHERCIGCKSCVMACPFHAPSFDEEEGATYKCDACVERRREGLEPRCVVTCPAGNITFGDVDDIAGAYLDDVSVKQDCPTRPNLFARLSGGLTAQDVCDVDGVSKTLGRGSVDL